MDYIEASNPFWGAVINDMKIDLTHKMIRFDLTAIDEGRKTNHILEINDYTSLIWIEKTPETHNNYDFSSCNYYEFTSIVFRDVHAYSNDKWLSQYIMNYNIMIEIWESALLIQSSAIIIDGTKYCFS